ncbi:aspartate aminotransferase family protein [Terrihabitans rhizophilus]|uniref:Aspartate aminotransferase family protein n=1 Tax=Terrihabitans rhizophilus TaxID=3092662 RepID=A0ABU4RUK5_9HYPH|nr:aspartate aminotransferase family protein [Terrihabitans sp. PJ23]MDX6807300.1 aspartate aminotransferase family protein [Terrihabitans sp. PJ23]
MTAPAASSNALDMSNYWMPFTANRQFKAKPRIITGAKGMHFTTDDGRTLLDSSAGLWCVNAGHARPEIADAVHRQLMTLDYSPAFQMGQPGAFEFAARLAKLTPEGMDRVFFTNSGSESVDTALKVALAYHKARGEGGRTRFIGREKGYNGVGFGGISVGGLVNNRRQFNGQMLPSVDHLPHTVDIAKNAFSRGLPEHGAEKADVLEGLIALHGADTIAAVIVEPVSGSAGVLPPPKGYLERLRAITEKHGILLIFDEVITGFGRLGTPFAGQFFGITPDLMTAAKGITNGVIPMGAVFVKREVHDALMTGPDNAMELFHGYTYSGHPVACAAGLATLDIYEREGLLTRGASIAQHFEDAVHSLKGRPNVIDIRNVGLMGAVELAPRAGAIGARGMAVLQDCFDSGLLIRNAGDTLVMSPPLIATTDEIDQMVDMLGTVLDRTA